MTDRQILITGAGGFVGTNVCRAASAARVPFRAFDFSQERLKAIEAMGGGICCGDITNYEQVSDAVKGVRAVVHLVAAHEHMPLDAHERITLGGIRNMVRACAEQRVKRVLFVSSIKAGRDYPGFYGTTKRKAEEILRRADLDFTIFRPALLYGPGEIRLRKIGEIIRKWRIIPVIGDGSYVIYPIFVDDLATMILKAIDLPEAIGKTYDMGGPGGLTYDQVLDCLMERLGVRAWRVRVPLTFCGFIGRILQAVSKHPIVFMDQVLAQQAVVRCDIGPARRDLGFAPVDFRGGLAKYYPEVEVKA